MRFLIDSNLSHRVAQLLCDAGLDATYEPRTPDEQAGVLLANLPRLWADLDQGAIVVIERSRLPVRRLPLLPPIPEQRER